MTKASDCLRILTYMRRHGNRITVRDIQVKLEINGATARLSDLRKKGYTLAEDWQVNPNTGSRYKVFTLVE